MTIASEYISTADENADRLVAGLDLLNEIQPIVGFRLDVYDNNIRMNFRDEL